MLRSNVLRLLERRFQTTVPTDLAAVVQPASNPDELQGWFDAVLAANTLEAFRTAIGR
jgi:hypothetical protein